MIRYISYVLPLFAKATHPNPVKTLTGYILATLMFILSGLFLIIAAFIWVANEYGLDVAFATIGLVFLFIGLLNLIRVRWWNRRKKVTQSNLSNDPLAKYVPQNLMDHPTVRKLIDQITDAPITAAISAVTIGLLLSREFLEEVK